MNDMTYRAPTEEVLSREEQKAGPLFSGRVSIHPKAVHGPIRRIKWLALSGMLALYYILPWLRWDRGPGVPDQALLIDLPNRRGYFFWIEIWPQEIYYVTGLLVLGALGLFLITAIAGRVWCGFACPQTVWTDLFMWVERKIEGDRTARIRLESQPWTRSKLTKRTLKHAAWLLIAFATGGAWIMYFKDAPTLVTEFFTGESSTAIYFFVGLFTLTTYVLAGFAREQVCTYMCPWPRFQAALLDTDSLVVTYRRWRGEPRGKLKKNVTWREIGDCIDCRQCVAVCPTGIDIRDGLQLECIGCGLCIDACNNIMDRVGLPRGLIAFETDRNRIAQEQKAPTTPWLKRLVRPRTIVYTVLIALVGTVLVASLSTRSFVELNILHDRNPLFVRLSDGSIRNGFTLKILNKAREERLYRLTLQGLPDANVDIIGQEPAQDGSFRLAAAADQVIKYRAFVSVPAGTSRTDTTPITFVLEQIGGDDGASHVSNFRSPQR